jgi:dihydroorotase
MANIIIQGGRVIDPVAGTWAERPLHIADGRLVDVLPGPPDQLIDADGAWVAPGFIDLHAHVFSHGLFGQGLVTADRIGVEQGVACIVDAGSAGASTIDGFGTYVILTQRTPVFAFINIGSPGLPHLAGGHSSKPEYCNLDGTVRAFERYGDWLVGVKMLASQSHAGSFGIEALKLARKAAELVDKPLMVHIGNAPPVVDEVLDLLRPATSSRMPTTARSAACSAIETGCSRRSARRWIGASSSTWVTVALRSVFEPARSPWPRACPSTASAPTCTAAI